MIKLKTWFTYKPHTTFFSFIAIILAIAINLFYQQHNTLWTLLVALSFLFLLLSIVKKSAITIITFMLFLLFNLSINYFQVPDIVNKEQYHLKIIKAKPTYCIAIENDVKYLIYLDEAVPVNSLIVVSGTVKPLTAVGNYFVFDFSNYLHSQNVYYQITNIKIISKQIAHVNYLDAFLMPLKEDARDYATTLLKGDKSDISISLDVLSITYLLSISGLQISFLFMLLVIILKLFFTRFQSEILAVGFIGGYCWLLNWTLAPTRAFLSLFLSLINRKFKLGFSQFDRLGIVFSCFIFMDPKIILRSEFIYSFTIIFFLLLSTSIWNKSSNKKVLIPLVAFLALLPINLTSSFVLNPLVPLFSYLLSPLILLLFLFTIITIIVLPLQGAYVAVVNVFLRICDYLQIINPTITFGQPSIYIVVAYYLTLFLTIWYFERKIYIIGKVLTGVLAAIIALAYIGPYLDNRIKVCFIDVGQGDSTLIIDKHLKSAILIDTGGLKYLDVTSTRLIPVLKGFGVKQLAAVIISHDDYDHNGALISLKQLFTVKKIITNNDQEVLEIGNLKFLNLNANPHYSEDNDRSLVLYFAIGKTKYLLPGDISSTVEEDIILNYPNLDVDVLHLAHHGSSSSSSTAFLDVLKPQVAIISVGANNQYHHPHQEVISRLVERDISIFRTDYHGMIEFIHDGNRVFINSRHGVSSVLKNVNN